MVRFLNPASAVTRNRVLRTRGVLTHDACNTVAPKRRSAPLARFWRDARGPGNLARAITLTMFWSGAALAQATLNGAWETKAVMPTARSEIAAATLDARVYVVGGLVQSGGIATFEMYDAAANRWQALAPIPEARHHTAAAGHDGRVYVSGGYRASFNEPLRTLWVYDPATNAWTRRADMPGERAAHVMVAVAGRLYVVGGVGDFPQRMWAYDPAADRWTTNVAALPTVREHTSAAALDGKLYVMGGRWGGRNLRAAEVYDPATDRWTRLPDLPTARGGLTAAAVNGRIHVAGGEELGGDRTFNQNEAFDPAANAWVTAPAMPTARHGLTSAGMDGVFYVIGGATRAGGGTYTSLSNLVEAFRAR